MVSRRDGSLPVSAPHPLGLYRDDCRFLSGHELCVNRVRPRLLVASAARGSESVHELTNPALPLPGGRILPLQSLQLRLERRIAGDDEIEETLLIHSYDREPLYLDLDLLLAADFEPMLAIRGILATGQGEPVAVERREDGVRFSQRGRDGLHRALDRHRRPPGRAGRAPSTSCASRSACSRAAPRRSRCATACTRTRPRPRTRRRQPTAPRRSSDAWLAERTVVETDDELFNRVLRRSLLDIRMLHSRRGGAATTRPACRGTRRSSAATR